MTFIERLNAELQNPNSIHRQRLQAMHAAGKVPVGLAVQNEETGELYVSDDGAPFEQVPVGLFRALAHGSRLLKRDPGDINPLAPHAVRRSPARKAAHDAKVLDMLLNLIGQYAPLVAERPDIEAMAKHVVGWIDHYRKDLSALPTVYDRWDSIIDSFIDWAATR